MNGIICKGDWTLGSACGQCERCKETALAGAIALKTIVKDLRAKQISPTEQDALWNWHHDEELRTAGKGEYDDAKWHRDRAAVFWRSPLREKTT